MMYILRTLQCPLSWECPSSALQGSQEFTASQGHKPRAGWLRGSWKPPRSMELGRADWLGSQRAGLSFAWLCLVGCATLGLLFGLFALLATNLH